MRITDVYPAERELDELGNVIFSHPKVLELQGSDFRHVQIRRLPPVRTHENGGCEHELGFKLKVSSNGEIVNDVCFQGSTEDVRNEVKKRIESMALEGGVRPRVLEQHLKAES
jgi:hypothetical protein